MPDLLPIPFSCVDPNATLFATFQNHNQKILQNRGGIFVAHIRSRNEEYTAQQWRLVRSTDGGHTFSTIYEATDVTNAPVLESDGNDDVLLFRVDWRAHRGYLYRFRAADGYTRPVIAEFETGHLDGGKFTFALDQQRERLYIAANSTRFVVLDPAGKLIRGTDLWQWGPEGHLEYPQLWLDGAGTLHALWLTENNRRPVRHHGPAVVAYRGIHYIRSHDAGVTWERADGRAVTPPLVPDETGPVESLVPPNEGSEHSVWALGFCVQDGYAHIAHSRFPHQGDPWRPEHGVGYLRMRLSDGRVDARREAPLRGDRVRLDGWNGFITPASAPAPASGALYLVSSDEHRPACLVSTDNGLTWRDHARCPRGFESTYSMSGSRRLSPGGSVLGCFTDAFMAAPPEKVPVYFIEIPGLGAAAPAG